MRRTWMAPVLGALLLTTACGELTIRTWVTLIEEESGGTLSLAVADPPIVLPFEQLQGGFLTRITLDTTQLLEAMEGSISLDDVRMAGFVSGIGPICTWNDPTGSSGGSIVMDLIAGTVDTEVFLDARATTGLSETLGLPPADFEEFIDFDLGAGFDPDSFLAAFESGSSAGLFETTSSLGTDVEIAGIQANVSLDIAVSNDELPPLFDANLIDFCGEYFAEQGLGDAVFYGVNAKSGYLRHLGTDRPLAPLVVALDEIGAVPGDTLRMEALGTYSMVTLLRDGNDRKLGGVFSSTDEVLPSGELFRIPGAIQTAARVNTWPSIFCFFGICSDLGGDDVPEDFRIDPSRTLVVPEGASFLVVAPIDVWRKWADNTGMGFGLTLEVNPAS